MLVVMGVAGCGKTSVGEAMASRLGMEYVDGDELHPAENIAKMSSGIPLEDEDRWPWLELVGKQLGQADGNCIVGCSALKRRYRDRIRKFAGGEVTFVHLAGTRELISSRMNSRTGHFMPTALLDSQFAALEPPAAEEKAIVIDIDQTLDSIVNDIVKALEKGMKNDT